VGQWRRRRKSKSAEKRRKSKVSHKSSQSVSHEPVSQPEVPWRPQLGGPVASSKEVQVSRKAKEVESQPQVESVSQPRSSQSAGSALAATIRWASGLVEGSPCQPKSEGSRSQPQVESVSQPRTSLSVSRKCPGGHNYVGQWPRRRKSKSAEKRRKSKVSHKSSQSVSHEPVCQSAGSALAATIRW